MKLYKFTIALEEVINDLDAIDSFYGKIDDASVAGSVGETVVHFDREADSLDAALHSALTDLSGQGWHVRAIAVEPECVLPTA